MVPPCLADADDAQVLAPTIQAVVIAEDDLHTGRHRVHERPVEVFLPGFAVHPDGPDGVALVAVALGTIRPTRLGQGWKVSIIDKGELVLG
jgi:hypothetical protein